jgi:hypothetical protein
VREARAAKKENFNKSYYYILPMLEKAWDELPFINDVYLFTKENQNLYEFYIVCFSEDPLLTTLPEYISTEHNNKTKDYIYRMRVQSKYEEDYLLFMLGKYSLFTDEYKKMLFKLLGRSYRQSNIYKVIQKDSKLRNDLENLIGAKLSEDSELSSIYNDEKETYNYND